MLLKMYSVYDVKTEVFNPPIYCHNDEHAKRVFMTEFQREDSMFSKFPEDFRIFHVGNYNDSNAAITATIPAKLIAEGTQLIKQE